MSRTAVPQRFAPTHMRGDLAEADGRARYWWASRFAAGRHVLDAGCGTGHGAALLAAAGAASVTAVDRAAAVVEAAAPGCPPEVTLRTADVTRLPFEDASFDLVVLFDVLPYVGAWEDALRELTRVLSANGILLVSAPSVREAAPDELRRVSPSELRDALERRFGHVELRTQANVVASMVMPGDVASRADDRVVADVELRKPAAIEPGDEPHCIALASRSPLPPERAVVAVTSGIGGIQDWHEVHEAQRRTIAELRARLAEATSESTVRELRSALVDAERRSAALPVTRERVTELERENAALAARVDRSAAVVAAMQASPSWRATAPLRAAKDIARRFWRR
jgi:SAM-dependent methyltransferase